ncbi:flagellin [Methylobacterium oryzisoli]|uniref:flagellin N-terminal helical domain-containing protein n=1 Tax=Methylobacterium oryzisoli TaxID=3385502 RepID=UPI0038922059
MASSITLSAATRQNLLSLQDTANLLSTTQSRLSTGKKVNSALDNPTNFFTAQSLTARSSDLSSLLDGISNGIQAIQSANQGITSLQKLLDTAKSTAQQALADKTGGTGGVQGGAAAQAAKVTGGATLASLGTTNAAGVTTFDLSSAAKDASLDISLDGGLTKTTIKLDATTLAGSGTDLTKVTADQILTAINGQIASSASLNGKVSAGTSPDGRITFTTTATRAASQLKVAGSANATVDIGYGKSTSAPTAAKVTANAALAATTAFAAGTSATFTVGDGARSVAVTLNSSSATDALGGTLGTSATRQGVIDAINKQLKDAGSTATASLGTGPDANKIVITSADVGPDAQISVVGGLDTSAGTGASGIGFSTFTAAASTAAAATSTTTATNGTIPAPVSTPGGAGTPGTVAFTAVIPATVTLGVGQTTKFQVGAQTVTINADTLKSDGTRLGNSFTQAQLVDALNEQLDSTITASIGSNVLTIATTANNVAAPTVTTSGAGLTDQIGLFSTPNRTTLGTAIPANLDLSAGKTAAFTVGGDAITLSATSLDANGAAIGSNPNRSQLVSAINAQLTGGRSAYLDATNQLAFVGPNTGTTPPAITAASDTIGLGIGAGASVTAGGTAATTIDLTSGKSSVFAISDGTNTANVTINALSLDKNGVAIGTSASQAKVAEAIQRQLDTATGPGSVKATVSFAANALRVTANAVGLGATAPTLTATSDTAGLGLGTTNSNQSVPSVGSGTAAAGISASGVDATDGSSAATIKGNLTLPTTAVGASSNASFTLKLGNNKAATINISTGVGETLTAAALAKRVNDAIDADTGLSGNVKASVVDNKLQLSTTASGSTQRLAVVGTGTTDIGFGVSSATTQTAAGTDVGGSKGTSSVRSTLATQYNRILQQISEQARDSGFNGVNLIYRTGNSAGDNTLHIAFNERNTSGLDIEGVRFDAAGLGLNAVAGDFQSDTEINSTIDALTAATTTLRSQSSTFGSNLSVVQNRQDFTKNLINILDTGSANLTNADLNEEAANSQALSTRNSLAVSALSLANQAQQGILQLLR